MNAFIAVLLTAASFAAAAETLDHEKALAEARAAVRAVPKDARVRVRYAELLLASDAQRSGESRGLSRAVEQALIALRDAPEQREAVDFLSSENLTSRMLAESSHEQAKSVEAAVEAARAKAPESLPALRALVRLKLVLNKPDEAAAHARDFAARAEDWADAQTLLGAAQLASGEFAAAELAFTSALGRANGAAPRAAAGLGLAEALRRQGKLTAASDALAAAGQLSPSGFKRAAKDAALPDPEKAGWELGTALRAQGDETRAALWVGGEGLNILGAAEAEKLAGQGRAHFNNNNFAAAQESYRQAAELLPANPVLWHNTARAAFEREAYGDCAWAMEKASKLETLDDMDAWRLGLSRAVGGDYRGADEILSQALARSPGADWLAQWSLIVAYAARGWDAAWPLITRTTRSQPTFGQHANKIAALYLILDGLGDLSKRASKNNLRYAAFGHEVLRYRATFGDPRGYDDYMYKERAFFMPSLAAAYRLLPLKPAVPTAAVNRLATAGTTGDYELALREAPWWAQGHRALAAFALLNYDERAADRAFDAFFSLVEPGDPAASAARDYRDKWKALGGAR